MELAKKKLLKKLVNDFVCILVLSSIVTVHENSYNVNGIKNPLLSEDINFFRCS